MNTLFQLFLLFVIYNTGSTYAQNTKIKNFGIAKSALRSVYGNKNLTFYCQCEYQKNTIKKSCKLNLKKFRKRQKRLEWEHVVPAHAFGQSFLEWRQSRDYCSPKRNSKGKLKKISNRKCVRKKNKLFRYMEADIYNLVPSIGAVNAIRSNFSMANILKGKELCPNGLIKLKRKVMPPKNKRGDVARIYQYMDLVYPSRGIVSKKNKKLFTKWALEDPVSRNECNIYKEKKKKQLNVNPVLEKICQKF
jgi:deoxyribonuclease-1